MSTLFLAISAAIYLSVGVSQLVAVRRSANLPRTATLISLWLASILSLLPILDAIYDGYALYLGVFHVLSIVTVSAVLVVLVMAQKYPTQNLGALLGPITALSLLGLLQADTHAILVSDLSTGMITHIVFSIVAYGFFTGAVTQALLLSIQNKHLHQRKLSGLTAILPPLQTMEVMLFSFIWLGFIALSIAILSGFNSVEDLFAQRIVHKTVLSLIAWVFFGFLLLGKHVFGWRGQRATRLTLTGFLLLVLGYFGSSFVIQYLV